MPTAIAPQKLYAPLVKLAQSDSRAQELFEAIGIDLCWVEYKSYPYLLRGQIMKAWDSPINYHNVYLRRHEYTFSRLGATLVNDVRKVIFSYEYPPMVTAILESKESVWLYTPRAIAFTAFIFETPKALAFQKKLGINVPVPLPTAFKYAGITD